MGNDNSSTIKINVDRNDLFYYSGETISGIVTLNVTEKNLEIGEIYINLIGEIGYKTRQAVSNGIYAFASRTEHHQVQFYEKKVSLSGASMPYQEFIYDHGQYSWPFQISLINNLPPSINHHDTYPHVRYYLQVIIDESRDIMDTTYLTIYPHVNLLENPLYLSPCIFECENRKNITLRATFNKLGYVFGENIQFTLEIQNPRKILIQHTNFSMLKSYRIGKNSGQITVYKAILPGIVNLTNKLIIKTFSINIPFISLPPSYEFQGEYPNAIVHMCYILKLTVKAEGIFTNCHIKIPIMIGTEPNSDLNERQSINPLSIPYSSNPEQSILNDDDDDDSPPDYDTAVQNL